LVIDAIDLSVVTHAKYRAEWFLTENV